MKRIRTINPLTLLREGGRPFTPFRGDQKIFAPFLSKAATIETQKTI